MSKCNRNIETKFGSKIHKSAKISSLADINKDCFIYGKVFIGHHSRIEEGTTIKYHSQILDNVYIGYNCFIDNQVYISKDSTIHRFVHIGNNSRLMSNTIVNMGSVIGDHVFIGAGSKIGKYVRIDNNVFIEANTIIPDYTYIPDNSFIGPNRGSYSNICPSREPKMVTLSLLEEQISKKKQLLENLNRQIKHISELIEIDKEKDLYYDIYSGELEDINHPHLRL